MESILGRSQFLGEAATLFTDEKTASTRARVIEWFNELGISEAPMKCELLAKIQEAICGACIELLDEFLENILTLAHDINSDVRKQVVGFIEQIIKVKVEYLPQVIGIVSMLLRDRSAQVIKRVIQACGSIYKNGLQWICSHREVTDSIEQSWNVLNLIKAQILDLIDNDNDGIRTNAIKFLEGVVVLQSYADEDSQKKENDFSLSNMPESLKFIKRQKMEEEALNIFDIMLKFHAATHISSVNLIACTSSLCTIAKLRPSLMTHVVTAFKQLNSNLPPTLTDSQVSSVRKSLKMQLMALLKNRGSYEYQSVIRHLLVDLGASQGEIQRSIPKMDKQEQQRRQKRILENATANLHKRMRLGQYDDDEDDDEANGQASKRHDNRQQHIEMELDEQELEKQREKSSRVNEKFLAEHLRSTETCVGLIMEYLPKLPAQVPQQFLQEFTPIRDCSIQQQVTKIARLLGEQMTQQKLGPGAAAFTKEPPMRPKQLQKPAESMEIDQAPAASLAPQQPTAEQRKEEATKKLRENMERVKGEQELIERMKQRAKTLKLQEITKPYTRPQKEKYLLDAVKRILHAERQCIVGGVSVKRRKILTVMAATFPDNVRYFIFDFIMSEIKQRIDLAFSWLYEEYCLLQGFTRHSYVKSENRPDYAYNELLNQLIDGIRKKCDFKDKITLLKRVYMEAPLIPDSALQHLSEMCLTDEYSQHCLELLKDLCVLRPPRKQKLIRMMLNFAVHSRAEVRERAYLHIVALHQEHKILPQRIEEFALDWLTFLEKEIPAEAIFSNDYGRTVVEIIWREELVKICMGLTLILMPYQPEVYLKRLCEVYTVAPTEIKRIIVRSIDVPIKKLGVENPYILKTVAECPKGTEALIIRIVHTLTERVAVPHGELVTHVRNLYNTKLKDVRVLIPILGGLTRQEVLNALPKILQLNQVVVKEVFNRLLGVGDEYANQMTAATPTDILVALHTIDISSCDIKAILKGTSICLSEKSVYTQEVLTVVLQQLVEAVPIPTLLMRTMIQSLTIYPRMGNFVLNLLQRLILKQVWRYKVIWDGFLKCIQRMRPQSLPILLQLPAQQLVSALQQTPDLRKPLLEYAQSIQDEPMSGITQQTLDIITGKTTDVFVTDESGGYITIENIKKEADDTHEISTIATVPVLTPMPVPPPSATLKQLSDPGQPLPPGED